MPSTPYPIRVPNDELAELKALADAEGVPLSAAMRKGARMYLAATPAVREAVDSADDAAVAKAAYDTGVERARAALRALK